MTTEETGGKRNYRPKTLASLLTIRVRQYERKLQCGTLRHVVADSVSPRVSLSGTNPLSDYPAVL